MVNDLGFKQMADLMNKRREAMSVKYFMPYDFDNYSDLIIHAVIQYKNVNLKMNLEITTGESFHKNTLILLVIDNDKNILGRCSKMVRDYNEYIEKITEIETLLNVFLRFQPLRYIERVKFDDSVARVKHYLISKA